MHFSTKIAPQKNWGWKWVLCQNGIYYKFSAVKLPKKGGSLHIFPIWLMAFQHNIMWQRVVQKCHFASFTISPNCPVLTCSGSDSDYDCVALDVRLVSFFFFDLLIQCALRGNIVCHSANDPRYHHFWGICVIMKCILFHIHTMRQAHVHTHFHTRSTVCIVYSAQNTWNVPAT